ncbi:uncharacterized protein LOC108914618 [Anoplophora glabripennis]|uniref:uncharacterized protein LOC108914618 n=1 Tax=Anoplophora glabripennis TaxID=217634 RepID=UPI0008758CC3|nr:uncharacterized protein LOC108914618 [Anoplophora glabripennis]
MVSIWKLLTISLALHFVEANFTKVSKGNVLLSRRRRYLNFPVGSNFIITLSHIKFLLQVQPRGWAILLEADVPFPLPTDIKKLKKGKKAKRNIDKDDFLNQVKNVLTGVGLNGDICIRKIMCAILQHKKTKEKSLVKDLLYAAFIYPEDGFGIQRDECNVSFVQCSVPLLEYLMGNVYLQSKKLYL